MPPNLSRSDRRLLVIAGSVFLVMTLGSLALFNSENSTEYPTSYSSGSKGAKAAYLLLEESGYQVERWMQSPSELPNATGTTLVLAEPQTAPTPGERAQLRSFVAGGGRIVASGMFVGWFLPDEQVVAEPIPDATWKKVQAQFPSGITRSAPEITMQVSAHWKTNSFALPLYGDGNRVVVVQYPYGKGQVIWWASSTPLTNAGLKEPGNLEFFLACIRDRQNNRILWDEYYHGYQKSLGGSIANSPVKWMLLQLLLLGMAVLFTFSRRSGPIYVPAGESRLSPLEFVYTLGGLYEKADAASVAVDVAYQHFRYRLTRRLGMSSNASVEELDRVVRDRWHIKEENFGKILRDCESARYTSDLRPNDALHLVRELHTYAVKFQLYPAAVKES